MNLHSERLQGAVSTNFPNEYTHCRNQGTKSVQKSRNYIKILGAGRVTWHTYHKDLQLLRATAKHFYTPGRKDLLSSYCECFNARVGRLPGLAHWSVGSTCCNSAQPIAPPPNRISCGPSNSSTVTIKTSRLLRTWAVTSTEIILRYLRSPAPSPQPYISQNTSLFCDSTLESTVKSCPTCCDIKKLCNSAFCPHTLLVFCMTDTTDSH